MPTKTEVTKGRWGGRWREGEGRRGRERKKEPKRKKERKKTRLQPDKSRDCRIFRQAGCYSYGDWSTKSWNRKGVYRVWWGHELTTHLWTSVNFAGLGSYISLLGFLTNYLILRRSLQQCWGIFANWPQLKVEKIVVCFTDVYWAIRRVNRGYFLAARRYEISLRVLKNIFEHEKINLVSSSDHVIFYLLNKHHQKCQTISF